MLHFSSVGRISASRFVLCAHPLPRVEFSISLGPAACCQKAAFGCLLLPPELGGHVGGALLVLDFSPVEAAAVVEDGAGVLELEWVGGWVGGFLKISCPVEAAEVID